VADAKDKSAVVEQLRKVIAGAKCVVGESPYSGAAWLILIDGWHIEIFDDAGQADYVQFVRAPDNSTANFDDYWSDKPMPLDMLTAEDLSSLETVLHRSYGHVVNVRG
jgi:hypothetical protein